MGRGRPRRVQARCVAPGCPRDAVCRGWCHRHYAQVWRHGHLVRDRDPKARERLERRQAGELEDEARRKKRAEAEEHYNNAVGVAALRFWRAQIDALA